MEVCVCVCVCVCVWVLECVCLCHRRTTPPIWPPGVPTDFLGRTPTSNRPSSSSSSSSSSSPWRMKGRKPGRHNTDRREKERGKWGLKETREGGKEKRKYDIRKESKTGGGGRGKDGWKHTFFRRVQLSSRSSSSVFPIIKHLVRTLIQFCQNPLKSFGTRRQTGMKKQTNSCVVKQK